MKRLLLVVAAALFAGRPIQAQDLPGGEVSPGADPVEAVSSVYQGSFGPAEQEPTEVLSPVLREDGRIVRGPRMSLQNTFLPESLGSLSSVERPGLATAGLFFSDPIAMVQPDDPLDPMYWRGPGGELAGGADTSLEKSAPAPRPRLLPDKMSFFERGMWGEDGFLRNIGIASPLTPEVRKGELSLRRTMLTMHQIGGFVTLGLMGATVFYGQRYLDHGARSDGNMHQLFVAATISSYSATGLLSIFSPPPYIRRDEVSTTTIHKTLAWVHFAGMIVTPVLGAMIKKRGGSYYEQAHLHQVSAYITTAVFTAAMVVMTF